MSKTLSSFISFKKNFEIKPITEPTRPFKDIIDVLNEEPNNFISATKTKNYIMNDGLVDWLSCDKNRKNTNIKQTDDNFTSFIMNQGNLFEDKVIDRLIYKFGSDIVKKVDTNVTNYFTEEKIKKTYDLIQAGTPIIYSGVLYHPDKKIFGIPDIIIRSDWVYNLCNFQYYDKNEDTYSAPKLRDTRGSKIPDYHYTIIDIKYTTLLLKSDGKHLLNSGFFPAYKSQIRVYLECLEYIQGYLPDKAFVLGRKWKYSTKGRFFSGLDCFQRLGCINYFNQDKNFVEKTKEALDWIRLCRSSEAKKWSIDKHPLPHSQLYPNMSSKYEGVYSVDKNIISDNLKELTSLWMVGVENRKKAHTSGVYSYSDKNCNSKILGINGHKTSKILDEVIHINSEKCSDLILPHKIKNNNMNWKDEDDYIYVDFETINDSLFNIGNVQKAQNFNYIFMIGVGYIHNDNFEFRTFKMKTLTDIEEKRICLEFIDFLKSIYNDYQDRLYVHWGNIERIEWNKRIIKYDLPQLKYFDLLNVFKDEPIVIKGCLNFKLKNISRKLKEYGFIKSDWNDELDNGKDAMLLAFKYYTKVDNKSYMDKIENYNKVDVIVLREILEFLKNMNLKKRKRDDINNQFSKIQKIY